MLDIWLISTTSKNKQCTYQLNATTTAMALLWYQSFGCDDNGVNAFTSSSVPRPSNNINQCNAMSKEGWLIINEGGWYIVNDILIVWAWWPKPDGIIIVRGRALIVEVVLLSIWGWYWCCCGWVAIIICCCWFESTRRLNRSRWQGVGHRGAAITDCGPWWCCTRDHNMPHWWD